MPNSVFDVVQKSAPIEVFALMRAAEEDEHEPKSNLVGGTYRTNKGEPWVLPVVRRTEVKIANEANHEYLPVLGNEVFRKAATALLLGENSTAIAEKRAVGVQTISGTGGLRLGADFLARHLGSTDFYVSDPTYVNHTRVFKDAGFKTAHTYRYWDAEQRKLDFDGLIADLEAAPAGAVIVLHACAHNPTGIDPTQAQWMQIASVVARRQLFPFFDVAYQGFASGDTDRDAWAVRYFVEQGFEVICAQSFAKNFGLYCERVGNLTIVARDASKADAILSQITWLVRGNYSSPPAFGSRIVATVLNDAALRKEWLECITTMSSRIINIRKTLRDHLVKLGTPGNWDFIVQQIGMFSYSGLTASQVTTLIEVYHVYLLKTGRISMCGVNEQNVEYIAKSIHAVLTQKN